MVRLFKEAHSLGYSNILNKFNMVVQSIEKVLKSTDRRLNKICKFFYEDFDPINDYHISIIYCIIPKLTQVAEEEYGCIQWEFMEHKLHKKYNALINENETDAIQNKSPILEYTNIIQKKISTWKDSLNNSDKSRQTGELIVVASLIDKSPNLGGLCRTCEVFGAKELIVNSANVTRDVEFQSLSMSSEKWMDIVEIKSNILRQYLLNKKEEGYCIIAAEQTSKSVRLNEYKFPKKSLLLLG